MVDNYFLNENFVYYFKHYVFSSGYRDIAKLFSVLEDRDSRSALCGVLQSLSKRLPQHEFTAAILTDMNAWDEKTIEEPDYAKRLSGFRKAIERIRESSVGGDRSPSSVDSDSGLDVDMCVVVIHHCAYVLATVRCIICFTFDFVI